MKCLNPACGSLRADELNVSLNVTQTIESEDTDYEGTTNYGDLSMGIGTTCPDCNLMTYQHDYLKIIEDEFRVSEDLIARGWAAVLPEPKFVYVVAWYSESGGEGTTGGFEWRYSEGLATGLYIEMARESADFLTGKHVTTLSRVSVPHHIVTEDADISAYLSGMTDALEGRAFDNTVRVVAVSINERRGS